LLLVFVLVVVVVAAMVGPLVQHLGLGDSEQSRLRFDERFQRPDSGVDWLRRDAQLLVSAHAYELAGGAGAEHWALRVGPIGIEIAGTSKTERNSPNVIVVSPAERVLAYPLLRSPPQTARPGVVVSLRDVLQWCVAWVAEHPTYSVLGDNCQLFVRDALHWLTGAEMQTQNRTAASGLTVAGIITGIASIGMLALAALAASKDHHRSPSSARNDRSKES
jgi:hypothetical protein